MDDLMNNTMKKLEDLVSSNAKLAELLHLKKEEEIEKKNTALYVFAIIGAIAAIALIAYAVYRYFNPIYVEKKKINPALIHSHCQNTQRKMLIS